MSVLSLEASTSSAKALLYDSERGILGVEAAPYPTDVSDSATFSPEGVIATVLACGAALLRRFPESKVEAMGLSSIWHSLLLLDGAYQPVGRGRTWADTSAAPATALLRQDTALARRVYQATGCPLHSTYNVSKWLHLKRTEDPARAAHVSCLPEYLFFALTGELATTRSAASGMGLLNTHTLDWDTDILELTGIQRERLGKLVDPEYSLPLGQEAARALGLPAGLPVAACGPDGALNHIAAGGLAGRVMTLSVGTSAAMRLAHRGPSVPEKESTWCYYCAEGYHLIGAATAGAGNCVNWFVKDLLGGLMSFPQLEAAAVAADEESAPYFLPFLFGERCPGWDDARLGGFRGIGPGAGAGAMYRAVLEGILFNLYQNYLILIENIGFTPSVISISGGITQSPFWTRLAADTFGAALTENTGEHASLLGAAYMAQRAVGMLASLGAVPVEAGKRHLPDIARHDSIMIRYQKWLEYYQASR